ncbi:MAG: Holliday junction resolvase RecU [Oscillospiraceae bacterium]
MSFQNNKKSGTAFENNFRKLLRKDGFWSHKLVENENGAPFDIIAVKDGRVYAFDCKECSSARFPLNRVEDNQITGMKSIREAGAETFFVFCFDKNEYVVSSEHIFTRIRNGEKSIQVTEYSTLEGWLLCR